jgi:HKD family nuclease
MKSLKPTRLFLQPQESQAEHIRHVYQRAFDQATELYVVSAYLRTWDTELKLNADCKKFMFVVGKDFGITRKKALHTVREWLEEQERPAREFRVAHGITGFHPKAVVWKEPTGQAYMLLGSSNLSDAAFNTNYEANVFIELDALSFQDAKKWFARIADKSASRPVTADWIENEYVEAPSEGNGGGQPSKSGAGGDEFDAPTLPDFPPVEMEKLLHQRRISRAEFDQYAKRPLLKAMRACAEGRMSDTIFYDELNRIWYSGTGRIQAQG